MQLGPQSMTEEEFNSIYPLDLQLKFNSIAEENAANNKEEARRLANLLSPEEKALFPAFVNDSNKLKITLKRELSDISGKRKAIIQQTAAQVAPTYSTRTAQTPVTPAFSSTKSASNTEAASPSSVTSAFSSTKSASNTEAASPSSVTPAFSSTKSAKNTEAAFPLPVAKKRKGKKNKKGGHGCTIS